VGLSLIKMERCLLEARKFDFTAGIF